MFFFTNYIKEENKKTMITFRRWVKNDIPKVKPQKLFTLISSSWNFLDKFPNSIVSIIITVSDKTKITLPLYSYNPYKNYHIKAMQLLLNSF